MARIQNSRVAPQCSLRLTGTLAGDVECRQTSATSSGAIVARELRRWFRQLEIARLHVAELLSVEDLNLVETSIGDEPFNSSPAEELLARVDEYLVDAYQEPASNGRRLYDRLRQFDQVELCALVDGIERWRLLADQTRDYRGWRKVGLQPPLSAIAEDVAS